MTKPNFHFAQINIGRILALMNDPKMAEFVANLERLNALADTAPGFVLVTTGR